jgi:Flp pilus assembly protein TadG
MRRFPLHHNHGQALPLMGLMAVVLFLMVGLAIDGGLLYAQRRVMQNTADAACLAAANSLALNEIDSGSTLAQTAESAAQQVILNNLGATPGSGVNAPGTLAYANISEIYSAKSGTGSNLTKGIEVNGPDVRVALQSPANTFFLRAIGYNTYTVPARAHCDATAGGGGVPFAVARWRGYDSSGDVNTDGLTTNKTLPQYYKQGSTDKVMTVRDMLGQEAKSAICKPPGDTASCANWPDWGAADYPGDPTAGTGLYSTATFPATAALPGPETVIAGAAATPNVGDSSFSGPIVLDFRQTTFPSPLFYNGLEPDTALNQYKDYATRYILGSYPGPFVIPGQQLAYYNGVSAGQIERPFAQRYKVGDKIAVLMYNGTINADPDFSVTFPSPSNSQATRPAGSGPSGCSLGGQTFDGDPTNRKSDAKYKINVLPQTYSTFKLRAFISSDEPDKWEGSWSSGGGTKTFNINGAAPVTSISTSGLSLDFNVRPTYTVTCSEPDPLDPLIMVDTTYPTRKNGAETIYLETQDTATGKRRAVYVRLDQNADPNDFYAYFSQIPMVFQPIEQGNSTQAELKLDKVSGSNLDIGSGSSKVQVGTINWFDASNVNSSIGSGTSLNGVTVDVSKSGSKNQLTIDTSSTATAGKEYYIRIPLTYGGFTHYVWYYIAVRTPLSNASGIGQYVYALGYANYKITDIGSNYIKGRAISGLMRDPSDIISGFQPRLMPWQ